MIKAVRTSETSVDNYFTRQYFPEDNSEQQMQTSWELETSHDVCMFPFVAISNVAYHRQGRPKVLVSCSGVRCLRPYLVALSAWSAVFSPTSNTCSLFEFRFSCFNSGFVWCVVCPVVSSIQQNRGGQPLLFKILTVYPNFWRGFGLWFNKHAEVWITCFASLYAYIINRRLDKKTLACSMSWLFITVLDLCIFLARS
jgi:hypothetical protein